MVSNEKLWNIISDYDLEKLGHYSFVNKIMENYHLTEKFTKRAIEEYKKFIYLSVVSESRVTPSSVIDKVWHNHLTYTKEYWNVFCPSVLGKTVHHNPSENSEEAKKRDREDFEKTIKLYIDEFGEQPPSLIWNTSLRKKTKAIVWLLFIALIALWYFELVPFYAVAIAIVSIFIFRNRVLGLPLIIGEMDSPRYLLDPTRCSSCGSSCGGD